MKIKKLIKVSVLFGMAVLVSGCESKEKIDTQTKKVKQENSIGLDEVLNTTASLYDIQPAQAERREVEEVNYNPQILTLAPSKGSYFYHLKPFNILEFVSADSAKKYFYNLVELSKKRREGFEGEEEGEFLKAFNKGGSSYVLAGKFLLHHRLRCNMTEEELEQDELWMKKISKLTSPSGYFRVECGWVLTDITTEHYME
ncbi:MAG: hypothetical protein ACQEQC_08205 [Elusimicrobiota bacterium]